MGLKNDKNVKANLSHTYIYLYTSCEWSWSSKRVSSRGGKKGRLISPPRKKNADTKV